MTQVARNTDMVSGLVMRTEDYSIFKRMVGNREVLDSRVAKLIKSIKEYGYIFNPIIVNENMEVIDGQGRLGALESLNLPVDYIVCNGLKARECVVLNSNHTAWGYKNYIDLYASEGNENYIRLREIADEFPSLGYQTIITSYGDMMGNGGSLSYVVKSGKLKLSELEMMNARTMFQYVVSFDGLAHQIKGSRSLMQKALAFAYRCPEIDKGRLRTNYGRLYDTESVLPYTTLVGAFQALNTIYDYGRKGSKKTHLEDEWDAFQKAKQNGRLIRKGHKENYVRPYGGKLGRAER